VRLSDLLELDTPEPRDPVEALLRVRAQTHALAARTAQIMSAIFPDYEAVVLVLGRREDVLTAKVGAFGREGDA
jgi:hypothetical protein